MAKRTQVRREASAVPPIEQKTLDGWGARVGNWGTILPRSFYAAPPEVVAPRLLGKILAHRTRGGVLAGRIVEVEAYLGPHNETPDRAAHSHRGPTPRNSVLFGPAGYAYVYEIYGRYFCMNTSCEGEGQGGGILIRALEPLAGPDKKSLIRMALNRGFSAKEAASGKVVRLLTSGPGRLCQALGLTRPRHNGLDLTDAASELQMRDDGYAVTEVLVTARIGIRHAVDLPLRFALPGNPHVSGPKSLTGERVFVR
jgi:DNA-3-methyladenine glycosylase